MTTNAILTYVNQCNPNLYHLIGKKGGKVIATGSVLCTPDGAFLYNVSTQESERNRGYSSYLCYKLLELSKKKGCMRAALVSSPIAVNVHKQLGFDKVNNFHIYI